MLALLALAIWHIAFDDGDSPVPHAPGTTALVERAVDGDTLLLSDHTRIRLLGVDTPETKRPDAPVEPTGAVPTAPSDDGSPTATAVAVALGASVASAPVAVTR